MNPAILTALVPLLTSLMGLIPEMVAEIGASDIEGKDELIRQIKEAQASLPIWE